MTDQLVFIPFGGVGEIGMNMAAYGFGPEGKRKWLVVDCGVTFGGPEEPGIDLVMADHSFLLEHADDVVGLVLTHAHEDHYGAVIDLWPEFDAPIYATPFTEGMLRAKMATDGHGVRLDIQTVGQGESFNLGPFTVELIEMSHSIPESSAAFIQTAAGNVLHTGDWKIEKNPVLGAGTNAKRLQEIGKMNEPLALICDSTNALKEGSSPSEAEAEKGLKELIETAKGRVAVTLFSSNLGRVISVIRAAKAANREVILAGRSLHRVVNVGHDLGLLEGLGRLHDIDAFDQFPRKNTLLICTGSQGESRAAMARIAQDTHPQLHLDAGDRVIFSSWAIPGNEKPVIDIQNQLIDAGIEVITNADKLVHVTGHPRQDELKQLYDWVKPDTLIPVHGEAAHLSAHYRLGLEQKIENVLSVRNGDMAQLYPNPEVSPQELPAERLFLDGDILSPPDESGVRDRRRLSFGGIVVVSLCLKKDGKLVQPTQTLVQGLPHRDETGETPQDVVETAVTGVFASLPAKKRRDVALVQEAVRRSVRAELSQWWGKKPNVSVFVHQV